MDTTDKILAKHSAEVEVILLDYVTKLIELTHDLKTVQKEVAFQLDKAKKTLEELQDN